MAHVLERWASLEPDKPLMVGPFGGAPRRWSYKSVSEDARRIAGPLRSRSETRRFRDLHLENSPGSCSLGLRVRTWARLPCQRILGRLRDLDFALPTEPVCAITQPQFAELIASACPDLA